MINKERMTRELLELIQVDSISLCERKMADLLLSKLQILGYDAYEDDAAQMTGGNAGNVLCNVKGDPSIAPILLAAHMDTVQPGIGKKPVIDGDVIKTDGTTVLGADDAAGIECILETIRVLKEDEIPHGDIQILFTVGEEIGLIGSSNMDYSKIYAKYGIVLDDDGEIGTVTQAAPSHNRIEVEIKGRAAHAGVAPEKGVNAIQIAAQAIAGMRLGLIDTETTANIGTISGGHAMNIVCDKVMLLGEARGRSMDKLNAQTEHMKECFEQAAAKFGGTVIFKSTNLYPSYNIKPDDAIMRILKKAAADINIELIMKYSNGGSDTNIINGRGIQAVNISVGMEKVHSVEEYIKISDMMKATEFLVSIVKNIDN